MDNYKEMYLVLFNAITEATKILEEAQKKQKKFLYRKKNKRKPVAKLRVFLFVHIRSALKTTPVLA